MQKQEDFQEAVEQEKVTEQNKNQNIDNSNNEQKSTENIDTQPTEMSKKESLDTYLQLKFQTSQKEDETSEPAEGNKNSDLNKQGLNLPSLIVIDDEQIPSLNLQPSPKSHKPLVVEIINYRTTSFMKLNTQLFEIRINNPNNGEKYEIERRFSHFSDLYEQIFFNHPGYIMFPFPNKTLQSFLRLKIGLVEDEQKFQIIEKRMGELESFLQWAVNHPEISNSEEVAVFLSKDQKQLENGRSRLNEYVEQYKDLDKNSFTKNIIDASKYIWSFFNSNNSDSPTETSNENTLKIKDMKKSQIYHQITTHKQKVNKLIESYTILLSSQKYFSQFNGMQTDIDILLKVCAKHCSGVQFCHKFSIFIETHLLESLNKLKKQMQQAEKSFIHILDMHSCVEQASNQLNLEKKGKILRRVQRAQRNFQHDWPSFKNLFQDRIQEVFTSSRHQWQSFKNQMKKIWKIQSQ